MAEGGTDSLRNNLLCENQEEKVVEEKSIMIRSGFPDMPGPNVTTASYNNIVDSCSALRDITPIHNHSKHSETDLKNALDGAPSLTGSDMNSNDSVGDQVGKSNLAARVNNVDPELPCLTPLNVSSGDGAPCGEGDSRPPQEDPQEGSEAASTNILSSYLRAYVSGSDSSSSEMAACPSTLNTRSQSSDPTPSSIPSDDGAKAAINDLSAPKPAPYAPMSAPMMMSQGFPGIGVGGMVGGGGMMPVMSYYGVPVGYVHPGQPAMMGSPVPSVGGMYALPANMMHSASLHMMHNIACAPQGAVGVNGANGIPQNMVSNYSFPLMQNIACSPQGANGVNGAAGVGPLTATFGGNANQQTLDSRNIPANCMASSQPSSEENNTGSSRSYSINPGLDTRLTRLRKPVLEWIRRRLEQQSENNWEALADRHNWNYEDIRAHLSDCKHNRDSPFLKLLETEKFNTYTVQGFLQDMKLIGRKDILMDFNEVLQKNSG